MKNLTFMTVLLFLLISFSTVVVEAQQETIRFYHPESTNLTIQEKCRVDGSVCDSAFNCYLSILSPNSVLIVDNVTMLGDSTYRNYTLNTTQTAVNGIYESTVDCDNSTVAGSNTFYYQVTPNGSVPVDTGQGLVLIGAIIFLTLIIILLVYMAIRTTKTTIMLGFLSLAVILMVFGIGFSLNILELSFGTFGNVIDNYSTLYILFTILLIVGAVGLLLYLIFVALNYYWQLRGMTDRFFVK